MLFPRTNLFLEYRKHCLKKNVIRSQQLTGSINQRFTRKLVGIVGSCERVLVLQKNQTVAMSWYYYRDTTIKNHNVFLGIKFHKKRIPGTKSIFLFKTDLEYFVNISTKSLSQRVQIP